MTSDEIDIDIISSLVNNEKREKPNLDENLSKHLIKKHNMSISKLEDLIMCPIHLGMMEDPRILLCGHAFCLNCLVSCLKMVLASNFCCPVCRRVCDIDNETVNSLPPSIAIKQLTDVIVEAKSKFLIKQHSNVEYISNESIIESFSTSVDQKRQFVNHLLKERSEYLKRPISTRYQCEKLHNELLRSIDSPLLIDDVILGSENIILHSANNLEVFNSTYELMDIETIRENMKKYSAYKLLKDANNALINSYSYDGKKMIVADVKLLNHEPEMIVWIGDKSNIIVVRTADHIINEFVVKIETYEVTPIFLKFYNNGLIFTAKVWKKQAKIFHFYLVYCSLNGKVIRKSLLNTNYEAITRLAGFCVDSGRGKIYLALPDACKITILSERLHETGAGYQFVDLHPTFVTQNNETAEIWVSCAEDGKIIIIDEETGSYRLLSTEQIYKAIPSYITTSEDNRIIFLDSHQNRVFWIRKRNDFILIQRVSFIGHHNKHLNGKILSMAAVTGHNSVDRLLFSIGNNGYIVRPAKTIHDQNHKHLMCNIV